jgi:hypothetical protein
MSEAGLSDTAVTEGLPATVVRRAGGDVVHMTASCDECRGLAVPVARQKALDERLWPCPECCDELVATMTAAGITDTVVYHTDRCPGFCKLRTYRWMSVEGARRRGMSECDLCAGRYEPSPQPQHDWTCFRCGVSCESADREYFDAHLRACDGGGD